MSGNGVADTSVKWRAIFFVSVLALVTLLLALGLSGADDPSPNAGLLLLSISLFSGFYVFFALVEMTFARHLIELRSTVVAWVVLLALLGYVGKFRASADINRIFHFDPGVFPLTLFATSVLHIADLLLWPMMAAVVIASLSCWVMKDSLGAKKDALWIFCACLTTAVSLIIAALLVWGRVATDESRLQLVYRIAHLVDFNASFRCAGIDETRYSVVYVDTDRTRVLVARKIDTDILQFKKAEILKPVPIPAEFPQVECRYARGSG